MTRQSAAAVAACLFLGVTFGGAAVASNVQQSTPAEPSNIQRPVSAPTSNVQLPVPTQPSSAQQAVAAAPHPWVTLVGHVAWPVAILIIAVVFRKSLAAFVTSIGSRITKLSVFNVGFELVPATAATATPLLDDIRTATNSAEISDSSRMMLDQVELATPADYAQLDIGNGEEWLTTRLYLAAVMLKRMRGVQIFVFVGKVSGEEKRFIAAAEVEPMRWSLARRYPWLESAWIRANSGVFPAAKAPHNRHAPPMVTTDNGAFPPNLARDVSRRFIESLQATAIPANAGKSEWTSFTARKAERAVWVTHSLLESLLPQKARENWVYDDPDAPRDRRTRALLRRNGNFVPVLNEDRRFVRLANRRVVIEDMARTVAEEPS